jgi:beta-barrel assembly-enhancing protease
LVLFHFWITVYFLACDKNGDFVIFSIEDDKALGKQVSEEIASKPDSFPVLDPAKYPVAYQKIRTITSKILNSGAVTYKNDFAWEVKIIRNDKVLNAFATPGGYIYVYTGLIKYLDTEDQLAGVMGHEIAHADQRHTSKQLQKLYGIQVLAQVILGENPSALESIVVNVAGGLSALRFSRDAEREADEYSVLYLKPTEYQCNGAAGFFEKMLAEGSSGRPPVFLSTHPDPGNRVQDINSKAASEGCKLSASGNNYQEFKNSLP